MLHLLNWFLVLCLVALWSLAAWAFGSLAAWTASNAGALAGAGPAVASLRLPEWLAPWLPPELVPLIAAAGTAVAPAIEALIGMAPGLAGGISVATWVIWGVGSLFLIVAGMVISGLIILMRKRAYRRTGYPRHAAAAHGWPQ